MNMKELFTDLEPYQVRLVIESLELREKIEKLDKFLQEENKLTPELERARMLEQLHCMVMYANILDARIANFL